MGRRASTDTPTPRLHRSTGRMYVTLSGRKYWLGRQDDPRKVAARLDELLGMYYARGRRMPDPADATRAITVAELVALYWDARVTVRYIKNGEPTTQQGVIKNALARLLDVAENHPANDLRPSHMHRIRAGMVEDGLSRNTVLRYLGLIRQCVAYGVEQERVHPDVLTAMQAVAAPARGDIKNRPKVAPAPDEVLHATLPHLAPAVADMAMVQRLTGMRPGEVCQMTRKQIDAGGDVWLYRPQVHKLEHHDIERIVTIGPKAQAIITPRLSMDLDAPIFANEDGNPFNTNTYALCIRRACIRHSVPAWSPNQLRHAAGVEAEAVMGPAAVRARLQHQKWETSAIYANETLAIAAETARRLG